MSPPKNRILLHFGGSEYTLTNVEGDVVRYGGDSNASAPCTIVLEGDMMVAMEELLLRQEYPKTTLRTTVVHLTPPDVQLWCIIVSVLGMYYVLWDIFKHFNGASRDLHQSGIKSRYVEGMCTCCGHSLLQYQFDHWIMEPKNLYC